MTVIEHVQASTSGNPYEKMPRTFEPKLVHWTNMNMKAMGVKEALIYKEARKRRDLPAPNAYARHQKWSDLSKTDNFQKLSRSQACSYIEDIVKHNKKFKEPGPGHYKPKPQYTVLQVPKSDTLQMQMPEHQKFVGQ